MQGKKLAFPWIPLVESGLFNGLQRIQIKKSRGPGFLQFVSAIAPCPRSPDSPDNPDQPGEQEQDSTHSDFRKDNVRARLIALVYMSAQPIPPGWRGPIEAAAFGPKPPRPKTAGRISWGRIIQVGTQSGRSQAASVLCAMCVSVNTTELIAVTARILCTNPRSGTSITARPQRTSIG